MAQRSEAVLWLVFFGKLVLYLGLVAVFMLGTCLGFLVWLGHQNTTRLWNSLQHARDLVLTRQGELDAISACFEAIPELHGMHLGGDRLVVMLPQRIEIPMQTVLEDHARTLEESWNCSPQTVWANLSLTDEDIRILERARTSMRSLELRDASRSDPGYLATVTITVASHPAGLMESWEVLLARDPRDISRYTGEVTTFSRKSWMTTDSTYRVIHAEVQGGWYVMLFENF